MSKWHHVLTKDELKESIARAAANVRMTPAEWLEVHRFPPYLHDRSGQQPPYLLNDADWQTVREEMLDGPMQLSLF